MCIIIYQSLFCVKMKWFIKFIIKRSTFVLGELEIVTNLNLNFIDISKMVFYKLKSVDKINKYMIFIIYTYNYINL